MILRVSEYILTQRFCKNLQGVEAAEKSLKEIFFFIDIFVCSQVDQIEQANALN